MASPTPTVTISANPATIAWGQSTRLTWSSTNVDDDDCTIDPGGNVVVANGYADVTPTQTTTYTITATNSLGTATASVTVTVVVYDKPTVSISVEPQAIASGGGSINLTWETKAGRP